MADFLYGVILIDHHFLIFVNIILIISSFQDVLFLCEYMKKRVGGGHNFESRENEMPFFFI